MEVGNGIVSGGAIYGTKFNDMSANAVQDPNEPGIEGWTIALDWNGDAIADRTTLTDRNGNYAFRNLPMGTYTVFEVLNSAWLPTNNPTRSIELTQLQPIATSVDFANQNVLSIFASLDGLFPTDPVINEGSEVQLTRNLGTILSNVVYEWSVSEVNNRPFVFHNPGDSATAAFQPLDEGDFLVTLTVTGLNANLDPVTLTTTRHILVRNQGPHQRKWTEHFDNLRGGRLGD